jgi:hypothetical protein
MRIHARDLAAGDILALNDWRLHVLAVEHEPVVGVRTTEFDFLIHFSKNEIVNVREPTQAV